MHSIEEILREIRKDSGLCQAIESNGAGCFNKPLKSRKFCSKHNSRLSRNGSLNPTFKLAKKCKFIDCEKKHFGKGYCRPHYLKYAQRRKCKIDNCQNKVNAKDLCSTHYARLLKFGDVNFVIPKSLSVLNNLKKGPLHLKNKNKKQCIVKGCDKRYEAKGLCYMHYQRWRKHHDYNLSLRPRRINNEKNG